MEKTTANITVSTIDSSIPEGNLLWSAIAIIGFLKFRDKNPELILEVLKDVTINVFVNETLEQTMERVVNKFKERNN